MQHTRHQRTTFLDSSSRFKETTLSPSPSKKTLNRTNRPRSNGQQSLQRRKRRLGETRDDSCRAALLDNGLCRSSSTLPGCRLGCPTGRGRWVAFLTRTRIRPYRRSCWRSNRSFQWILFLPKEKIDSERDRLQPLSDMPAASPLGSCTDEMVLRQRTEICLDQTP